MRPIRMRRRPRRCSRAYCCRPRPRYVRGSGHLGAAHCGWPLASTHRRPPSAAHSPIRSHDATTLGHVEQAAVQLDHAASGRSPNRSAHRLASGDRVADGRDRHPGCCHSDVCSRPVRGVHMGSGVRPPEPSRLHQVIRGCRVSRELQCGHDHSDHLRMRSTAVPDVARAERRAATQQCSRPGAC